MIRIPTFNIQHEAMWSSYHRYFDVETLLRTSEKYLSRFRPLCCFQALCFPKIRIPKKHVQTIQKKRWTTNITNNKNGDSGIFKKMEKINHSNHPTSILPLDHFLGVPPRAPLQTQHPARWLRTFHWCLRPWCFPTDRLEPRGLNGKPWVFSYSETETCFFFGVFGGDGP